MPLINYEELEKYILDIESILTELDQEEKHLVLRQVNQRFAKSVQELKIKENMNNTLPKWVQNFINKKGEEDGN